MKARHFVMAVALLASGWLALFGNDESGMDISEPVVRSTAMGAPAIARSRPAGAVVSQDAQGPFIMAIHPRAALIKRSAREQDRNTLFGMHNWTPPGPLPAATAPAPPAAPALPFKYLGKSKEGDDWQVFLARDAATFIVKEKDVIESVYQVQKIEPPSMLLLYLPLNQPQSLTIE